MLGIGLAAMAAALGTAPAAAPAAPAMTQDQNLDLRQPANFVPALQRAGYKAELKKNDKGEPYISSAANGTQFTIEFYGCEGEKNCGSYQFHSWWKKEPIFTPALANEWNVGKRFLKIAIDSDGDLREYMDMTAIGTISYENFADIVDWYVVMDGDLTGFLKEHRPKK